MLENIRIVLVRTSHPGNIGAVARAMKNMGLLHLHLVAPDEFPSEVAEARSVGAKDLLETAHVHESVEDAIGDCSLVIGTSARNRRIPWPMVSPRECASKARPVAAGNGQVAILFGRENRGLSNAELQRCNYHLSIPANPDFPVMNLGMAVQVVCYELRQAYLEMTEGSQQSADPYHFQGMDHRDVPLASAAEVERMFVRLEKSLAGIGFFDPDNPRQLLTRLQRLLQRSQLDQMEVNIFHGICSAIDDASSDKAR